MSPTIYEQTKMQSTPLGVISANGNEICEGYVIEHNDNKFLIRWSAKQKGWVAKKEGMASWRDLSWIKNVGKYCKIIGNYHFDEWAHKIWTIESVKKNYLNKV